MRGDLRLPQSVGVVKQKPGPAVVIVETVAESDAAAILARWADRLARLGHEHRRPEITETEGHPAIRAAERATEGRSGQ